MRVIYHQEYHLLDFQDPTGDDIVPKNDNNIRIISIAVLIFYLLFLIFIHSRILIILILHKLLQK